LTLISEITIFVLAVFVGFEVISKVPTMLHTPLMSGTNAIHGIVLLGGLLVVGQEGADTLVKIAGTVAVAFGTINIVGGFLVTDRMLEMFKGRGERKPTSKTEYTGRQCSQRFRIVTPISSMPVTSRRRCCSSSASRV
jgi:H+-translocating NAD(P) transhydrogenase subunit alpha